MRPRISFRTGRLIQYIHIRSDNAVLYASFSERAVQISHHYLKFPNELPFYRTVRVFDSFELARESWKHNERMK